MNICLSLLVFVVSVAVSGRALSADVTGVSVDGSAIADERRADDWLSYGRTYSQQRFSPLSEINLDSVKRLGLKWSVDLPREHALVATPLVVNGTLYFSGGFSVVYSVDARTGKLNWIYDPKTTQAVAANPDRLRMMWGVSRGIAFWKGRVFVGTADGRLIAIDAATGKQRWSVQTFDPDETRYITGAPLAFNDKVLIGHGGADYGPVRGYVTAYDTETGKQVWRFYTVPGNPADGYENKAMEMAARTWKGQWWKYGGGGTVWNALTYDPKFNRVYLGVGNGTPWNQKIRSPGGGDNLFLSSIVALDADTGEYAWHYQTNPGETWDYSSSMDMVLAQLPVGGKIHDVLLHAPKNGFFYVIDRVNGKLLAAEKIVRKVSWAQRIDLASGRPVEIPGARLESGESILWPGLSGSHNWMPMSFNPMTRLVYIPIRELPARYTDGSVDLRNWRPIPFEVSPGETYSGVDKLDAPVGSFLQAWDPQAMREVWRIPQPGLDPGGTLTTQGMLVFEGQGDGHLVGYDARTGAEVWRFDALRGINAPPISYQIAGHQMISVLAGWGGSSGTHNSAFGWSYHNGGRRLLTFALDANASLPATDTTPEVALDVPDLKLDQTTVSRGRDLYASNCYVCHGDRALSGGGTPNLRASALAAAPESLRNIVLGGALQSHGMPKFVHLKAADVDALYQYIRFEARESLKPPADSSGPARRPPG